MSDRNHHRADRHTQQESRHSRTRSRSPGRRSRHHRSRSRSPHQTHHHHRRSHHSKPQDPLVLPYNARQLSRHDLPQYESLFAMYLDIQKQLDFEELSENEVKGRWKSFVGKWNRGELAEGWYDPVTKQKADASDPPQRSQRGRSSPEYHADVRTPDDREEGKGGGNSSDDDSIGPPLPGVGRGTGRGAGPTIPSLQDLEFQREMAADDELLAREDLRHMRKVDRQEQKERLDELVPRAEAGTRERQLEKKREVNEKMRSFREKSPGAGDEVGEKDLMGDDGIDAYRAQKREHQRKKNERELRKEEILRARAAEREERLRIHRAKEEKTVGMLKALAKQNFG